MFEGIILAGGFSSRAQTNKMCLEYKDKPLILNTILTMHEVCEKIIVVTGYYHDEIFNSVKHLPYVDIVYNKDYAEGMFSSILAGVKKVNNHFFITPGDYPKINKLTYIKMSKFKHGIVVPSFDFHLGHPILFDKSFKEKILSTNHNNLKEFRNEHGFKIVEVDDSGILEDIDSIKDYKKLLEGND